MARIRVGVVFGGRSGEHEVSVQSARSVLEALDRTRFDAVPLAITADGRWILAPNDSLVLPPRPDGGGQVAVLPGETKGLAFLGPGASPSRDAGGAEGLGTSPLDVVFPVLHGPGGEDGTIQGLLEMAGLPYVGAGVLGSALGMDKAAQKDVLMRHGLSVLDYVLVQRHEWQQDPGGVAARVLDAIGLPCFVKPANLGSSVGITKVKAEVDLSAALERAARLDRRVICERAVDARELECGVLGNEKPDASVVGEIIPGNEFYDYAAKYTGDASQLVIPAEVGPETTDWVRQAALRAFSALDGAGMARVDFFLERTTGRLYVNEVNTIPGFTATSMYPKLWAATGLAYGDLLTVLIELALARHEDRRRSWAEQAAAACSGHGSPVRPTVVRGD